MATSSAEGTRGAELDLSGIATRAGAALLLVLIVAVLPLWTSDAWDGRIALIGIYGIIGLSFNIITGYAGQISLGHQAFVGIGAFAAAYMVGPVGAGFVVGFVAAGALGAFLAFVLGLVALRVKGLYFALVTLAFGLMAETTIFNWRAFTGGGAGAPDPRPVGFGSDQNYAYLCLLFLAFFLYIDWRMSKSKPGRAVVAVRNNETVAASLGVNVAGYKLLAFTVGGFLAGVAGALYASFTGQAYAASYQFPDPALVWLLMAVVGGLGSRAGVVLGSAFFAILSPSAQLLSSKPLNVPGWLHFTGIHSVTLNTTIGPLVGAILLIATVTLYPGGIGQQLLPIRRWMAGGPLRIPPRPSMVEDLPPLEPLGAVAQPSSPTVGAPAPSPAIRPPAPEPEPPAPTPVETPVREPEPEPEPVPEPEPAPEPAPASTEAPEIVVAPEAEDEDETQELAAVPAADGDGDTETTEPAARRSRLFGFRRRKDGDS